MHVPINVKLFNLTNLNVFYQNQFW